MKQIRQIMIAIGISSALISAPVMATNISFDVTGSEGWGPLGNASNTVATVDLAAALGLTPGSAVTVDGVGWDVNITANGFSWLSEASFEFDNSTENSIAAYTGAPGSAVASPGTLSFMSPVFPISDLLLSDGILRVEFFDSFQDGENPDSVWNSGDLIISTVDQAPVSEPSSMVGFLAAGFAGTFIARRRQSKAKQAGTGEG